MSSSNVSGNDTSNGGESDDKVLLCIRNISQHATAPHVAQLLEVCQALTTPAPVVTLGASGDGCFDVFAYFTATSAAAVLHLSQTAQQTVTTAAAAAATATTIPALASASSETGCLFLDNRIKVSRAPKGWSSSGRTVVQLPDETPKVTPLPPDLEPYADLPNILKVGGVTAAITNPTPSIIAAAAPVTTSAAAVAATSSRVGASGFMGGLPPLPPTLVPGGALPASVLVTHNMAAAAAQTQQLPRF